MKNSVALFLDNPSAVRVSLSLMPDCAPSFRMSSGPHRLVSRAPSLIVFIAMAGVENDNGSGPLI